MDSLPGGARPKATAAKSLPGTVVPVSVPPAAVQSSVMSDSGLKITAVGLVGVVVLVSTYGGDLQERTLNLGAPLANVIVSSTSSLSASGTMLYLNFELVSVDPQQPDHLTAERPPFDAGGAALIVPLRRHLSNSKPLQAR